MIEWPTRRCRYPRPPPERNGNRPVAKLSSRRHRFRNPTGECSRWVRAVHGGDCCADLHFLPYEDEGDHRDPLRVPEGLETATWDSLAE